MIARGWPKPNLWRGRHLSVSISQCVQSRSPFSVFSRRASWDSSKSVNFNPLNPEAANSDPTTTKSGSDIEEKNPSKNFIGFKDFGSSPHLRISKKVKAALAANKPVVALESTIYTHGLPYPDNAVLAVHLENTLRDLGVTPATIGLVDGVAVIGLNSEELSRLASAAGRPETMKVSRRDLPYIIGMGLAGKKIHGGTTVAATMYLAELCGIKVFATGGIGGVHRGGQDTMDVSADLTELGRTSIAVIASGCKSFLDIPRTLEYLETQGATVGTYSETDSNSVPFPAFYTTDSGVKSPLVIRSPEEAAGIIYAQELLGSSFTSGFLLANPIPEEYAIPKASIDLAIEEAVSEAAAQGMVGHRNTPFILARIKDLTKGKSVVANKALIENNVKLAARVAQSLSDLKIAQSPGDVVRYLPGPPRSVTLEPASLRPSTKPTPQVEKKPINKVEAPTVPNVDIMVFGSVALDLSCDHSPDRALESAAQTESISPVLHTSNLASINTFIGGVGHNVALAAHHASAGKLNVRLCSYIADDFAGTTVRNFLMSEGLDIRGVRTVKTVQKPSDAPRQIHRTAQYVAVNDQNKELVVAMADMSIFSNRGYKINDDHVDGRQIRAAKWTVIDANWDSRVIHILARAALQRKSLVAFEPVSVQKSARLFNARFQENSVERVACDIYPRNKVNLASPNKYELAAMHAEAKANGLMEKDEWWKVVDAMGIPSSGARDRFVQLTNSKMADEGIPVQSIQLLPFIPIILTKLGSEGVLHTELLKHDDPRLTDPLAAPYILSRCANGTEETDKIGGVYMRLFPAAEVVEDVVSVNGVGDTFLGVLIAGLASGWKLDEELIHAAQRGAVMTLRSSKSVSLKVHKLLSEHKRHVKQKFEDDTDDVLDSFNL